MTVNGGSPQSWRDALIAETVAHEVLFIVRTSVYIYFGSWTLSSHAMARLRLKLKGPYRNDVTFSVAEQNVPRWLNV